MARIPPLAWFSFLVVRRARNPTRHPLPPPQVRLNLQPAQKPPLLLRELTGEK